MFTFIKGAHLLAIHYQKFLDRKEYFKSCHFDVDLDGLQTEVGSFEVWKRERISNQEQQNLDPRHCDKKRVRTGTMTVIHLQYSIWLTNCFCYKSYSFNV